MSDPNKVIDDDNEDPVYVEDSEDFRSPKGGRYRRLVALTVGLLLLVATGIGIYFFLDKNGYKLRKDKLKNENFQGTVSSSKITEHNNPNDCWLALHGKVYDLTDYAPLHPGSPELITTHCGTDATVAFDTEHPLSYLPIVDQYLIGTWTEDGVVEAEVETTQPTPTPVITPESTTETPSVTPLSPVSAVPIMMDGCEMQRYTLADLAEHSDEDSCWYGLYGVIYDFTDFVDLHPGGRGNILWKCGTDATEAFEMEDKHDVKLLLWGEYWEYIIGRQGDTSGIEIVPCDEVNFVAAGYTFDDDMTWESTEISTPSPSPVMTTIDGCEMDRYTVTDIAEHNDASSCWYGLYGVVYDFTDFVDLHPGGRSNILWACGTDATEAFEMEDEHDVNLLLRGGYSDYIIGRQGSISGIEIVPCDEVDLVAAGLSGLDIRQ